jgi:rhodanese-related sulfurtransferase
MRLAFLSLLLVFVSSIAQAAPLTLGVVLDQNESFANAETDQRYRNFASEIGKALDQPVRLQYFKRGFTAIKQAKEGTLDIVFGPAHVIANISKFKFEPILKTNDMVSVAFVAGPNYKGTLAAKSNAKLGVPEYESLVGGMARSEINSRGLAKTDFAEIKFHRIPEAPLYGVEIGRYDMAVATADEAKTWAVAKGGRIVFTSAAVPLRAMSVLPDSVPASAQQKLVASLKKGNALNLAMSAATPADFKGIASMLNTTPTSLPGAKIVSAAEAKALIAGGMTIYDVRLPEEYEHAHIPGATFLEYKEVSPKEVGFDPSEDKFDLSKLPADKNTAFMMYCDGTICWKSYKSATMAIKNGWKNVIWYRGGMPEWREAGFPVEAKKK